MINSNKEFQPFKDHFISFNILKSSIGNFAFIIHFLYWFLTEIRVGVAGASPSGDGGVEGGGVSMSGGNTDHCALVLLQSTDFKEKKSKI